MSAWYRAVDEIEITYLAVECNGPMVILKGDMDGSDVVDGGDIPAFVAAAISSFSCRATFAGAIAGETSSFRLMTSLVFPWLCPRFNV